MELRNPLLAGELDWRVEVDNLIAYPDLVNERFDMEAMRLRRNQLEPSPCSEKIRHCDESLHHLARHP